MVVWRYTSLCCNNRNFVSARFSDISYCVPAVSFALPDSSGITLYDQEVVEFLHILGIILSFFFGASTSAAIIGKTSFKLTRPYNKMIIFEGLLLIGSSVALAFGTTS